MEKLSLVSFSNQTAEDKSLLKQFVDFHWSHYRNQKQYVPLLDYEFLGSKLLGMTGYFEPTNLFFKHGISKFFIAFRGKEIVGTCNAFVDHSYNSHWNEKRGFFGNFECVNDPEVSQALLNAAENWVREQGMNAIRGPQNFPMNEATPGFLVEGFESRPVIYYHYNYPYYSDLATQAGYQVIKHVRSWEVSVQHNSIAENLDRLSKKIISRYDLTIEDWGQRPYKVRKKEMFEMYNDAWNDNFGFVPFTEEEFYKILDDMQLIMIKKLFLFIYVKGEPAAFFGAVPNLFEKLVPPAQGKGSELIRAVKMILGKSKIKGFRIGYLGVKKKFRHMGLDGVLLWKQSQESKKLGYNYSDMGWVLEDNKATVRLIERCGASPSKKYAIFEKRL